MTKTEKLNALLDEFLKDEHGDVFIEFRPFHGWFAIGEPRYIGDKGEYLGRDYREAEQTIPFLFA